MISIVDKRIPDTAKEKLSQLGNVIPICTEGIVYDAIKGHPDLFFCKTDDKLIVAPNLPAKYFNILKKENIPFIKGGKPVGDMYPYTAHYNAVISKSYFIHNKKVTDPVLLNTTKDKQYIHVNQAYTRCSLLPLHDDKFITSDMGIYNVLQKNGTDVHWFSPEGISLPGFIHGFLGGALGIMENNIFILGSLSKYKSGNQLRELLEKYGYQITELYDGPLLDGGSIIFF